MAQDVASPWETRPRTWPQASSGALAGLRSALSSSFLHVLFLSCPLIFLLDQQIGTWYSNNTLVMNSTSLDLNASETLANKTLIVTTILVHSDGVKLHWLFVLSC